MSLTGNPDVSRVPAYRYLFGPVPSRRLGRSLGVDLLAGKSCTFNCVFCQLGAASPVPPVRRAYAPVRDVASELERWLASGREADAITLSGSGEPTLHTGFGEFLAAARGMTTIRRVLLSNGSLMHLPEVRRDASAADVVKVSLSAWDQASFEAVNRPHAALKFEVLLDGLRRLAVEFAGELWVEVFVVPGLNAAEADMRRVAELAAGLRPAKIHLNTAVRPAADAGVAAEARERLERLAALFTPRAEVIADFRGIPRAGAGGRDELLAMLSRRPCAAEDVAAAFGLDAAEARRRLDALARECLVRAELRGGRKYYAAQPAPGAR
ncbi:MAG: radical SAM protein [Lentisphaerae bacterium]|nr:radical SAM protein [Lentisphaerota bacterium]